MTGAVRTAVVVLGVLGIVVGALGLAVAAGQPLTAPEGARIGAFVHVNLLGAGLTLVLGAVALVGAGLGARAIVAVSGAGWLVGALLTVLQSGRDPNLLGGSAATLGLFMAVGTGLLVLAAAPDGPGHDPAAG